MQEAVKAVQAVHRWCRQCRQCRRCRMQGVQTVQGEQAVQGARHLVPSRRGVRGVGATARRLGVEGVERGAARSR